MPISFLGSASGVGLYGCSLLAKPSGAGHPGSSRLRCARPAKASLHKATAFNPLRRLNPCLTQPIPFFVHQELTKPFRSA